MPAAARAARIDLETLLRTRKLDNTLTSALPFPVLLDDQSVVPTGIAVLDAQLHGGVPRGQISEIVGPRSSGRASLLCSMLAGTTGQGEIAALVDTLDMFDAASAAACGIELERLLWIRGEPPSPCTRSAGFGEPRGLGAEDRHGEAREGGRAGDAGRGCPARVEAVLDRAIKALNLVLQAGGFGLVALDLTEVPPAMVRRLPFTTWLRLQRVIEGSPTACLLLGAAPVARSAGGVTIALKREVAGGRWSVATDHRRARLFLGLDIEARLSRARWPETTPCRFQFST